MEASTRRLSAAVWDLAIPAHRQPGLAMAGFGGQAPTQLALQLVPYPAVTVFIEFGDGVLIDAMGARHTGGGLVGLTPGTVTAVGRSVDCLQIRLSPLLAHTVFGDCDATGVLALDAVWGRAAERLCERLHAASSWDERFAVATTEFVRRGEAGSAVDPEVAAAWNWMVRTHGRVRVERIADEIGWSRKRLWSRFGSQIGLPPKRAAQLVRFDDAAHRLATGIAPSVVAAACGYADQSHLHRDARLFAGLTPAAVAAAAWLDVDDMAWR
ncbi:helix-turn-helix domain-containing protein [Mycobacterium sp. HM-7]